MSDNYNFYFPLNNLNPQGWISEFITPILSRTGNSRSDLSSLFYDNYFDLIASKQPELIRRVKNAFGNNEEKYKQYKKLRKTVGDRHEEKMIFLNGNHLDIIEIDKSLGEDQKQKDLRLYTSFMSSIKPYQLAFLQPYIKLSYGVRKNTKEPYVWYDFPFTQTFDLDYILSAKGTGRAEGSGIESVRTNNKFNLATQINSEISISYTFGNLNILTREIDSKGKPITKGKSDLPYGFSFTKLIANLDSSRELIKLEYGRKVADGFNEVVKDNRLKTIIEEREKKVYLLSKYAHSFRFDEKGVVTISAEYYNFHDSSILSENNIGLPSPTPENRQKLKLNFEYGKLFDNYEKAKATSIALEDKLKEIKTATEAGDMNKTSSAQAEDQVKQITKKLSETNKLLNSIKRTLKIDMSTVLLDQIKAQGQLFSVSFNTNKLEGDIFQILTYIDLVDPDTGDFLNIFILPKVYDPRSLKKNAKIQELIKTNKQNTEELLTRVFARIFNAPYDEEFKESVYGNIMFFPLRALISSAYSFLDGRYISSGSSPNDKAKSEKAQIPYMLFGNVLMKVGDKTCSVNIGDLLVEAGTFQKWYYEKFYKKDRLEYSFGAFINDIMTDLVPEILYRNRVGFDDNSPTTAIKQTQYYLKANIPYDMKRKLYLTDDEDVLSSFCRYLSKNPKEDNVAPLIYYGQLSNPTTQITSPTFASYGISDFTFNEVADAQKGIPHIKIGSDSGLVKNVDFSHQDFSKIRSALAAESLANNASRYFFFYYQIYMDMFGNNTLAYDTIVCIPSNPLGISEDTNDPGIAGYYKVIQSNDTISARDYTTSARADWFFSPNNNSREKSKIFSSAVSQEKIKDSLPVLVTDPVNYLIELLEKDAVGIINSQLQKVRKPENKTKEEAKKDKEPKAGPAKNLDRKEDTLGSTAQKP